MHPWSHPEVLAGALADLEERRMAAGDLAAAAPLGLAAFAFCLAVVLLRQGSRLTHPTPLSALSL